MSERLPVVAVLGAGNMAGALARRWAASGAASRIRLTTGASTPDWLDEVAALEAPGGTVPSRSVVEHRAVVEHRTVAEHPRANIEAVAGADVVVIGVKPPVAVALLREVVGAVDPGALIVSVAGGVRLAELADALTPGAALVRTMPNTPVAVGRGVTAMAVAPGAPPGTAERARALFAVTGMVEEMAEEHIDAFSAVVGSGPAYVYAVIEALVAAGAAQGIPAESLQRTVPAMIGGAVAYLEQTGREPADLRREVTSPGGSTAAALAAFEAHGLADALAAGVRAATERASGLGRG